jgi:hypothetical protein
LKVRYTLGMFDLHVNDIDAYDTTHNPTEAGGKRLFVFPNANGPSDLVGIPFRYGTDGQI